jgi:tetratricopeptide (TPR) repeat protein
MRPSISALVLACGLALGGPATLAAAPAHTADPDTTGPAAPPADPSSARPRGPASLDDLFERLSHASDASEAKGIAATIERRWLRSGSDTADLLLSRAMEAVQADDQPLAIELLDRVIVLQPDWAEAWNKRATVFFMMGDYTRSMADLREVLAREPRHYAALAGMGTIFSATGDDKHAYEAYKKALAVNPFMDEVKSVVDKLAPDIEGRDI